MGFYERRIFPWVLDRAMRGLNDYRAETLAPLAGDVLEIGFGTGLNLRHYPEGVERVSAVDPMEALPERVGARIEAAPFPVERHALPADRHLPFDDGRFDGIAVTWTLCTIPGAQAALAEMRRVARPGAPLVFIEHGLSDDEGVARWQHRLNPLQNRIGCGCNLNRPIDQLIESAGFRIDKLQRFCAPGPRIFAEMYQGLARA